MTLHLASPHHVASPPRRYDVVIVGGRVAGAATAMLLARSGLEVLVVDQGAPDSDTLSTHALMRGGVLQLSRWGLIDQIVAAGTPPVRRTTFTYADQQIGITIKPSHGVDALYAPRRTVLDPILARAALDAGAEIRYHTKLIDLLRTGNRVTGIRISTGAHIEDISARLVIGADGLRSAVAHLVGAKIAVEAAHSTAVTYGYWSELPVTGYEWVFRRNACSGAIPTNDGRVCVFASAAPDRIGRGGIDLIDQIVSEGDLDLSRRLRAGRPPAGTRTWGGRRGFLRQSHGAGWALVGDAGYFKDPISAHGLTDALRDAELLARAVIAADDDGDVSEALTDYQSTRDRLSLPLFETVDRIAGNSWDDDEIAALLLQLSSAMTDEVEALAALDLEHVQ
jgi:2-polyprenyl-6-methoxyphenol hydroxylase-like FAD-dependent oxidoreductase